MDELFICPINFRYIFSIDRCPNIVYTITLPSIFIYCLFMITYSAWFVLGFWKSILIEFLAIHQNIIYILSIYCTNRSPTRIKFNHNIPLITLLLNISKHMCLATFCVESNPALNTVKLMVFKFLMLHEITELPLSVDYYEIFPGNNFPTNGITIFLVGMPSRNQLLWSEVDN